MKTIDLPVEDETGEEPIPTQIPELVLEKDHQKTPLPQEPDPSAPPMEQLLDDTYPPAPPRRKKLRAEAVMGIIAGFCAVLLCVTAVLCIPYYHVEETDDPEAYVDRHQHAAGETEAFLEPTQVEEEETLAPEETQEPTIPPEKNPYGSLDFQYQKHNYLYCLRTDSYAGIDVSAYQGNIDWKQVKNSGIEFAIIRLGYRGYGQAGRLVEDEFARQNLQGAADAGLAVGAYFFSQALSIQEAEEEIAFMLEILGDYKLEMPIILDWEIPGVDSPRTANMDARTLTDIQLHFCQKMTELGYQPMVYFNWHQSETLYYLSELEAYPFWLALYQDRMTYPWKVEMWQYSDKGSVPGINGPVDLNVYMPY